MVPSALAQKTLAPVQRSRKHQPITKLKFINSASMEELTAVSQSTSVDGDMDRNSLLRSKTEIALSNSKMECLPLEALLVASPTAQTQLAPLLV